MKVRRREACGFVDLAAAKMADLEDSQGAGRLIFD